MQISAQFALILGLFLAAMAAPNACGQGPSGPHPSAAFMHRDYPNGSATALGEQITILLADPSVSRAHWGVAVTTLEGTPLYGLNEGQMFRPASNNKIFTTATAMALLGPAKTFDTRIFGRLDAATGTVTGDLTLVGGGDANFGADDLPYLPRSERAKVGSAAGAPAQQLPALADLAALADLGSLVDQLVAKGVKRVTGDIVGDDTLFPYEPYAESWAQDDQVWGYGAPVSALSIDNNQLKLTVTPGAATGAAGHETLSAASVSLDQHGVAYYTVEAQVATVAAGSRAEGVQVERLPGSRAIRVYGSMGSMGSVGSMAADAHPDTEDIAIADPAEYAAMALRGMLEQRGVVVTGVARAQHRRVQDGTNYLSELLWPDPCNGSATTFGECANSCTGAAIAPSGERLASHTSAPLDEDVVLTNKVSQNLHAEVFLHNLGLRASCGGGGGRVEGARVIRSYLTQAGLDPDDFIFFDGSGLSEHDLVAPRAMVKFLAYVARQPWFAQWKASLPDAGEDGTLEARFPTPPLKGHLFAKTGTLGETDALSGYLDAASGRTLIFSIFVDTHMPTSHAARVAMDKIVSDIAASN